MLIDAREVPRDARREFDVCIVGAGPAGITLAQRLESTGLRIALLEGGGFHRTVAAQSMFRGEVAGQETWPLQASRFRVFGGTGVRWGGMARPLDPIDYEERPWVGGDGWPVTAQELAPYDEQAAEVLGLTMADFDPSRWAGSMPETPLAGGDLDAVLFQFSPLETRFGERRQRSMVESPSITLMLHADVTDIRLEPGTAKVRSVEVRTMNRSSFAVEARAFVLAGGAVENARLLLASRSDRASGLGNEHDQVGRHFMDHLHVAAGHVVPSNLAVDRGFFDVRWNQGVRMLGALAPSAEAQRTHELLSASMVVQPRTYQFGQPFLSWPAPITVGPEALYRRLRAGHDVAEDIDGRYRGTVKKAWYASQSLPSRRAARRAVSQTGDRRAPVHTVYFRSEQRPNPSSRVSLSRRTDRYGKPLAKLDWRLDEQDFASILGWARVLDAHVRERGLGVVVEPAEVWREHVLGGPHHMGTTRMSATASTGVVDANCRVHTVDNLYVAGSSIFASGGYANPTFALLAFASRLADHLAKELSTP